MEIRDPIYGLVRYSDLEEKVMNHWVVQRLRNIHQLAMAYYVYPSALHTRFEHSLGVMHVAGLMAEALDLGREEANLARLAGLLHDVGHGPFSHVSEQVLERRACREAAAGLEAEKLHEALTARVISEYLCGVVPEEYGNALPILFTKKAPATLVKNIISGPLDADKIDYLLRDSYFAGVKYGVFDRDKVIESLRPVRIGSGRLQVGISDEGVYAVEQMLLARYHMRTQVSGHRIRRITDAMLVRGMDLALDEGIEELQSAFLVNTASLDAFLQMDDRRLTELVIGRSHGSAGEIFRRLRVRNLYKEMFSLAITGDSLEDDEERIAIRQFGGDSLRKAEARLAKEVLGVRPEEVIIDRQSTENPTFRDPVPRLDPNTIVVLFKENGLKKQFTSVSAVFQSSAEPSAEHLYVYAPFAGSREKREEFCRKHRQKMFDIILEMAKEGLNQ